MLPPILTFSFLALHYPVLFHCHHSMTTHNPPRSTQLPEPFFFFSRWGFFLNEITSMSLLIHLTLLWYAFLWRNMEQGVSTFSCFKICLDHSSKRLKAKFFTFFGVALIGYSDTRQLSTSGMLYFLFLFFPSQSLSPISSSAELLTASEDESIHGLSNLHFLFRQM